jgi:hypothetical protein
MRQGPEREGKIAGERRISPEFARSTYIPVLFVMIPVLLTSPTAGA